MPKRSSSSVVVRSTPRKAIEEAVTRLVEEWRCEHPEIEEVIWFGSWVNGLPGPGSDVDLCLILTRSSLPMRERGTKYLPVGFPVGVDLVAYTREEFQNLPETSPNWFRCISRGRRIF